MNATIAASIATAGVAVLGCIGSVLLLAFRIGKLTGEYEARMAAADNDRASLHTDVNTLEMRLNRHLENHAAGGH